MSTSASCEVSSGGMQVTCLSRDVHGLTQSRHSMSDANENFTTPNYITDIILDEDTLRTRETDGPRPREVELRQEWTRENDEYFFI